MAKKLVILISGAGSNMVSIVNHIRHGHIDATVECVISDNDEEGINKARYGGLNTKVISPHMYDTQEEFDKELLLNVKNFAPDFVICAGYLRILSLDFVKAFEGKIINIHPSLLPKYAGRLDTHAQVLKNKDKYHGCTVHYVIEELDAGEIIDQVKFEVNHKEPIEFLEAQVKDKERQLYPKCLAKLCNNQRSK